MESRRFFPAVCIGTFVSISIAVAFSILMATLLYLTSLTEQSVHWVMVGCGFLALFVGGFFSGAKAKNKGWLAGAFTAFLFVAILLAISYLGYNESITSNQVLLFAGYCAIASLGGVFGVNFSGGNS
ncbi:TIGR04086 family membrane protein [Shouchella clausii]|uniref:TIGR04086 family membrane protein n=1 Tax=Shouchella clausii TaxID=79880 RepID=UPI00280B73BD|nr:TIGR04086 family membrane protein [Shouchella clausii]WMM32314.1 TIGR04086 family membrane protein [Shouchella clausii]